MASCTRGKTLTIKFKFTNKESQNVYLRRDRIEQMKSPVSRTPVPRRSPPLAQGGDSMVRFGINARDFGFYEVPGRLVM
eukprot:1195350-Prorocentrum_minimum.AAC.1